MSRAAGLECAVGARVARNGWLRCYHPPGAVERPRHAQLIGKNEPHPAVAEAGTGAALEVDPAQDCDVVARSVSIG